MGMAVDTVVGVNREEMIFDRDKARKPEVSERATQYSQRRG